MIEAKEVCTPEGYDELIFEADAPDGRYLGGVACYSKGKHCATKEPATHRVVD